MSENQNKDETRTPPNGPAPVPPVVGPRPGRMIVLGAVILLCGMVLGAGVTFLGLRPRLVPDMEGPRMLPDSTVGRLREMLDLSDEQARQIQAILARREKALLALRSEMRPRVNAQLEQTRQEIAAVLTPEQAARWNEQFERSRRRWMQPAPRGEGYGRDGRPKSPPGGPRGPGYKGGAGPRGGGRMMGPD